MADPVNQTAPEDRATGGHFTVVDRRPTGLHDRGDFHVKGCDKCGRLLLFTWHTGEHSMLMEVSAWLKRGALPQGDEAIATANKVRAWA